MEHRSVTSSYIKSVAYDPAKRLMHVAFTNGATFAYPNVPPYEHRELMNATSIGRHFHENIRGKYTGSKV